ncbi:hypothetical protein CsSME_00051609 [Camellia sinensis var. sinensis]
MCRNQKTFRPKKSAPSGSKLQNHIDATLGSGNLREAVRLPPGEHPNEWLAVNKYLMDWIEAQLDDKSIFPQKLGASFPPNFQDVVKTIFKRLFHVYAHIYHTHFEKIVSLKEEAHLNTCFKHFVLFTWVSYPTSSKF